jgi:5'(3')-deoxyribonucleotidase
VYVTAAVTPAKIEWMQRFDLISRGKTLDRRFIVCSDKRLINADIIIDDKAETVFQWPSPKTGILFAKPWNNVRMWPERLQRLDGWSEVLDYLSLRTLDESRRFYAEYGA